MNETAVRGLRELAGTVSQPGNYAVLDSQQRLVMGWLTHNRAEQYVRYYANGKIVTMAEFKQIRRRTR